MARQGQGPFRRQLLLDFGGTCCLSGCQIECLLEAAHICTHDKSDDHARSNGLLLRADLHTLFDLNLLSIDADTFEVRLDTEVRLAAEYGVFHGRKLSIPQMLRSGISAAMKKRAGQKRH